MPIDENEMFQIIDEFFYAWTAREIQDYEKWRKLKPTKARMFKHYKKIESKGFILEE